MFHDILSRYGISGDVQFIQTGTGLIHRTWKAVAANGVFILQQMNNRVFREPEDIAWNIQQLKIWLGQHHPGYLFVAPVATNDGSLMVVQHSEYFRLFNFVEGTVAKSAVSGPGEAFEAARQFGRFTRNLDDFPAGVLRPAIPGFHDLSARYHAFLEAVHKASDDRKETAAASIQAALKFSWIEKWFSALVDDPSFRIRVMHHDAKISNVLFNARGKGVCVIDLDTVMPGYFFSDVGDMIRSYVSGGEEDAGGPGSAIIRRDVYEAIVTGYLEEMGDSLTSAEREGFFFSGALMIWMQALRFLTDHLHGDIYYATQYPGHNLQRAQNQLKLLEEYLSREEELKQLT